MKKYNLIWKHWNNVFDLSGYHVYVNSKVGLWSERQIAQIPANSLSSVTQYVLPRGHLVLPHPGFETKRTGIPASILKGSLLKAIYWLLPLESPSHTHLLEPEPDSKQNTPLLSRTHQRLFLPKVYNGWISASGEYSNMCTIVSLIAVNIYIVLISRLYIYLELSLTVLSPNWEMKQLFGT